MNAFNSVMAECAVRKHSVLVLMVMLLLFVKLSNPWLYFCYVVYISLLSAVVSIGCQYMYRILEDDRGYSGKLGKFLSSLVKGRITSVEMLWTCMILISIIDKFPLMFLTYTLSIPFLYVFRNKHLPNLAKRHGIIQE